MRTNNKKPNWLDAFAEKFAKINELNSEAEYKSTRADMEIVKEMIELEDLDLQNLKNNLELAQYIRSLNEGRNQEVQYAQASPTP